MRELLHIFVFVLLCGHLQAQVSDATRAALGDTPPPSATVAPSTRSSSEYSSSNETKLEASPFLGNPDVKKMKIGFDWQAAANQSFFGLAIQHGIRMSQSKTRREMGGPFFEDYRNAVSGLDGWGDTDSVFTNYVAHPFQGAVTGFIQIQNDPHGIRQEFGWNSDYWWSRTRAMAWAAFYSTQFELGPVSEASIGNVGKKRGTMGFVDLVMTPVGGMGLIVAEDVIDKKWIQGIESHTAGLNRRRVYRMVFNPQRTLANLLRLKKPWHRDTRSIDWQPDMPAAAASTPSTPTEQ
jgi:hypothetical protein